MAKEFFPNIREEKILSRLDSSKDHSRERTIYQIRSDAEELSNRLAQRLTESGNITTTNRAELIKQIELCLKQLVSSEDFEIEYRVAPIRNLVPNPHFASLYVTSFLVEKLIDHPSVDEIYGTDEDIYRSVDSILGRLHEAG